MYFHELTYDIDEIFSQNLHIHGLFSKCAKREMTAEAIVREAEKCGLKMIAITNHIQGDEDNLVEPMLKETRDEFSKVETDLKVLIGAELSAYGVDKYNLKDKHVDMDYYLYSHNHYHMPSWEQPEDRSPEGYKKHCYDVLSTVIKSGKADCLAHPFVDGYLIEMMEGEWYKKKNCVTGLWTDNEIGDILTLGRDNNVAWELNVAAVLSYPDFAKKYFNIGKEVGIMFNAGTDAHKICNIDTKQFIPDLKKVLL